MTPSRPVLLLTGAAGALGRALRARVSDDYDVVGLDLQPDGEHVQHRLDVTDTAACDAVLTEVANERGAPTALVNAAGIVVRGPSADHGAIDWRRVLEVNLTGTFLVSQAFQRVRAPEAAVVNVSSLRGVAARPGAVSYAVSKAGVAQLTRVLAREWGPLGCRTNAVAPSVFPDEGQASDLTDDPAYVAAKVAGIPLGRLGTMDEMVAAIRWLLSDEAGFVNGVVLRVDGGEAC